MNVLSDYDEYLKTAVVQRGLSIFERYIRDTFWPFNPGHIATELDSFNHNVTIYFENFPSYTITVPVDYNSFTSSPHEYVGREAWLLIRNVLRIDPPDNIVLGDD